MSNPAPQNSTRSPQYRRAHTYSTSAYRHRGNDLCTRAERQKLNQRTGFKMYSPPSPQTVDVVHHHFITNPTSQARPTAKAPPSPKIARCDCSVPATAHLPVPRCIARQRGCTALCCACAVPAFALTDTPVPTLTSPPQTKILPHIASNPPQTHHNKPSSPRVPFAN